MARQSGFFDTDERLAWLSAAGDPLERLAQVVDFSLFRDDLEAALNRADRSKGGRPPYDAVLMFKVLVLQTLYTLSDEQAEYQIRDRLSFMRFVGLALHEPVPDAKTIWLHREQLVRAGAFDRLFARFDRSLRDKGFLAMGGQIVDATVVEARRPRLSKAEKETLKDGGVPADWSSARRAQIDTQGRWTIKRGRKRQPPPGGSAQRAAPGQDAIAVPETRHVHGALKASLVKTDRRDAHGLANLLRLGWFKPVHVKSTCARELRVLLAARETLVRRLRDLDNSVRGLLRGFGLRPPRLLRQAWADAVRALIAAHPTLTAAIEPILIARDALNREVSALDKKVRDQARDNAVCRRLMTVPGVGAIVALTYVATIDDPARFAKSKAVGHALGLTPIRYQSGESDRSGPITKAGDARARVALLEAAHVIMTRVAHWFPLKAWAMRIAARRGAKRAKVALARKLAVILHRMWIDGTDFQAHAA